MTQERELLDDCIRSLRSKGCTCAHNVPYAGCKIPQFVEIECSRCGCIRRYEEMHKETNEQAETH